MQFLGILGCNECSMQAEAPGDSNVAEVLASQPGGRRRAREAPAGAVTACQPAV